MYYKEEGFRKFYKKFVVLPLDMDKKMILREFPRIELANAYLAYGYVDHNAGFTFDVLCLARVSDNDIDYFEPQSDISVKIRIDNVEDVPLIVEHDPKGNLKRKFASQLNNIEKYYDNDKDILITRDMEILDNSRHESFVDDIQVYFFIESLKKIELVWVRLSGFNELDKTFYGYLMNEPFARCGVHQNDIISFSLQRDDNGKIICVSVV